MKIRIYLQVNEYATDGYSFQIVPADGDYLESSETFLFVQEIPFNLNTHLPWLCQKAQETGVEMAKEASDVYNRATARRLEFEAKFLQLEHITNNLQED